MYAFIYSTEANLDEVSFSNVASETLAWLWHI